MNDLVNDLNDNIIRLEIRIEHLTGLINKHCNEVCGLAPHGECHECIFGEVSEVKKAQCPDAVR